MRVLVTITILFSSVSLFGQFFGACSPNEAYSCETAKEICQDHYTEYCQCPKVNFTNQGYFWATDMFYFDVEDPNQTVTIDVGGYWYDYQVAVVGPIDFSSTCGNWIPATDDLNSLVSIINQNSSIGLVNLPNIEGRYYVFFTGIGLEGGDLCHYLNIDFSPEMSCIDEPCETCIGSFAPIPKDDVLENGEVSTGEYLITAWAKEGTYDPNVTTYTAPQLSVVFNPNSSNPTIAGPFTPEGQIIDGWQRIEQPIIIPAGTVEIQILLESTSGDVYFDDIRMLPFDASMKSYVYDPINMRLSAELDERHYATFYEYDEEGKLVRIKKETEKGVMTIQETKSNSSK